MYIPLIEKSALDNSFKLLLNTHQPEKLEQPPISYSFLVKTGTLSLLSTVVFFASSLPAGQRYSDYAAAYAGAENKKTDWFFVWTTAVCASLTMLVFDWEVYFHKWHNETSFSQYLKSCAQELYVQPLHVLFALCCGLGNLSPLWYVSLTNNMYWNILITLSTLAAAIIFYDGVQICYEVVAYAEAQRFIVNCRLFLSCITGESQEILNDEIEWAKIKSLLYKTFDAKQDAFYYATDEDRIDFNNNNIQNYFDSKKLPSLLTSMRESYSILLLEYLLDIACIVQNFGFIVEAFEAGMQWGGLTLGVSLAVFSAIPGIGFTIKGILGKGILDALCDTYMGRTSQMQRTLPMWVSAVGGVMYVACVFSSFACDTLNYRAAKYVGCNESVAIAIAAIANVGCALVFHLPQYILLKTCLEESLLLLWPKYQLYTPQIRVQSAFRGFCGDLKKSSLSDVKDFVTQYYASMGPFFQGRGFKVLKAIEPQSKV